MEAGVQSKSVSHFLFTKVSHFSACQQQPGVVVFSIFFLSLSRNLVAHLSLRTQCRADEVHDSVKIFVFDVGETSVVELTIACELECVVESIDMHNEPG